MTDEAGNNEWGIDRRTILKSMGAVSAAGFIGVPAFSGSVAAKDHIGTMTLVSGTDTMVTRRRAGTGENETECGFTDLGVNAVPSWEHPAWADTTECFDGTSADWIWYSTEEKAVPDSDEYYVLNNERGDVVEFEREFNIDGPPVSGSLMIAVDNGFEAYVNGEMVASRAVNDVEGVEWECSDLKLPYVETDGWKTEGDCANITFKVSQSVLNEGDNTLTVLAVNAHNRQGADDLEDGNNPGGLIYKLDVSYERCEVCEDGTDLLEKYEWDDYKGEFVREGEDDMYVSLDSESVKTDEDGEPIEACFSTDYCELDAVVKAGTEYEVYEDVSGDVCVSGIEGTTPGGQDVTYAISNVRFYCEAPENLSVGNSGQPGESSDKTGEDHDKGHGNDDDGDDGDNPGNNKGGRPSGAGKGRGRGR